MIAPQRLHQLSPGQKRRKLALTFGELERDILGIAEPGLAYDFQMPREQYIRAVCAITLADEKLAPAQAEELRALLEQPVLDQRRACNVARNALLAVLGTFPAEWDLIIAPHPGGTDDAPGASGMASGMTQKRSYFANVNVFAEDIRSPFNLGSIFRTAEAMGCDKVFLSPRCTDAEHPKAQRSSMGCIRTLGYTRCTLDDLDPQTPVFVLETGGTPITQFAFPRQGTVIIGSEELGVSPEALRRATHGTVSIPMTGLKASLNVGVAFGILMQAWTQSLAAGATS